MPDYSVGLGDISVYVPRPRLDLELLLKKRVQEDPSLERRLSRAISSTGQKAVRFPDVWEDPATLAAQAMLGLPARADRKLRYLAVGTESSVDHSKPISAYVQGMMQSAGAELPEHISTFQVQHACAGGTIAALSVGALLAAGGNGGESGVVVCSDVARYEAPSTAEPTQGAGAVALAIEQNPRLLTLDIGTAGYSSHDVDDFFRPLDSVTARVKGGYSIQCYNEALESAFQDHCRRRGEDPVSVVRSADLVAFHVPFHEMAILAAHKLVGRHLGITGATANDFLRERGFNGSLEPLAQIGNIYTGSVYLALAFLLAERYRSLGDAIIGKRVLIASYGSGNTMAVISGTVAPRAGEVISQWDLESIWREQRPADWNQYERWISGPYDRDEYARHLEAAAVPSHHFYLAGLREDGYREYQFKR